MNQHITNTTILLGILVLIVGVLRVLVLIAKGKKAQFEYVAKDCIMTPAEQEHFLVLMGEMGRDYHFFPQVHLDAIVAPKYSRRWRAAFNHIKQKSVDFVACDKQSLRPVFVLEVDDKTHKKARRMERDREVERILSDAGIPCVRIENRGRVDPKALAQTVRQQIKMAGERGASV